MAATAPWKKAPYTKEWMVQTDLQKEASAFERMNGLPQLLSSSKIKHYFKIWMDESGALKSNKLP